MFLGSGQVTAGASSGYSLAVAKGGVPFTTDYAIAEPAGVYTATQGKVTISGTQVWKTANVARKPKPTGSPR